MGSYRASIAVFGGVSVTADDRAEAIEKLNDAIKDYDMGDGTSLSVTCVERGHETVIEGHAALKSAGVVTDR